MVIVRLEVARGAMAAAAASVPTAPSLRYAVAAFVVASLSEPAPQKQVQIPLVVLVDTVTTIVALPLDSSSYSHLDASADAPQHVGLALRLGAGGQQKCDDDVQPPAAVAEALLNRRLAARDMVH